MTPTVCLGSGGVAAPCIYLVDLPVHPFGPQAIPTGLACTVVRLPIDDWDVNLTPWPAPSPFKGAADFSGGADATVSRLLDHDLARIEREHGLEPVARALCGYSLGGLFALHALVGGGFVAAASVSGSLWYPGWTDWLATTQICADARCAYLSLGTRERHARRDVLQTVLDRTVQTRDILTAAGLEAELSLGPGAHTQFVDERVAQALIWLDAHLSRLVLES